MNRPRPGLPRPDTVLQRAPDVRLTLTGSNTVKVERESGSVHLPGIGLRALERFAHPTSLRELAREPVASAHEWMDLLTTALILVRHGVLRDAAQERDTDAVGVYAHTFDNPAEHIRMLHDTVRTERFIEAIEAIVTPGDVVVEIGTGTGVLAMAAARAGAAHVYAIEAGAIGEVAKRIIAANGYEQNITVLRGWSTSVSLPRSADVLITETIGSDPLDERILEVIHDARHRLLVAGASIIPSRIKIFGTAVAVPWDAVAEFVYTDAAVARWKELYNFDFSPVLAVPRRLHAHRVPARAARRWPRLAPPELLADIDLRSFSSVKVDAEARFPATRSGMLNGALLHFEAELAPGIVVTSDPLVAAEDASWANVLTLQPPVRTARGDQLRLAYRWRAASGPLGLSVERKPPRDPR